MTMCWLAQIPQEAIVLLANLTSENQPPNTLLALFLLRDILNRITGELNNLEKSGFNQVR